jgi:hypothetical protein
VIGVGGYAIVYLVRVQDEVFAMKVLIIPSSLFGVCSFRLTFSLFIWNCFFFPGDCETCLLAFE